eukprot:Sdes_comp20129_c0_seq1m13189
MVSCNLPAKSTHKNSIFSYTFARQTGEKRSHLSLFQYAQCLKNNTSLEFHESMGAAIAIAFNSTGQFLACGHGRHTLVIRDISHKKKMIELPNFLRTVWAVKFHPEKEHIVAAGCLGGLIMVYDIQVRQQLNRFAYETLMNP